jgi:predicted CXXCH cytochrome family protein
VPQTCARCHSLIYEKYKESVHGSALIGAGNPDVPTCTDCHGVHNIEDPTTVAFRLNSPQICAKCHTDPTIVGKYGLSTDVLDTYVADFHGATQVLFEPKTPDAQFNTPVCFDCHGVHDIARTNDPQHGIRIRENLLIRCQECHPDATTNFPEAWMSHYTPSPDTYPIVYYVNLFYMFLIPVVIGGMGLLVAMDFSRLGLNRYRAWQQAARGAPAMEASIETEQAAKPDDSAHSQTETSDSEADQHG